MLGCGGMGIAYLAEDRGGRKVVVKQPNPGGNAPIDLIVEKLEKEAEFLREIWNKYGGHPNIVKFIDFGYIGATPLLVEEYVEGANLADYVVKTGGLDPDVGYNVAVQLADALAFLHRIGILHRDFTPDNVRIQPHNNYRVVLIDFGTVERAKGQGTQVVKPGFSPPEIVRGEFYGSSDVYMWGATVLSILRPRNAQLAGLTPQQRITRYITPRGLADGPCNLVDCGRYERKLSHVLSKALDPDYRKRFLDGVELRNALIQVARSRAYLFCNNHKWVLDPDKKATVTIGKRADISLDDPYGYLEERHVEIQYDEGSDTWLIRDLGSVNGTAIRRYGNFIVVSPGCRRTCPGTPSRPVELQDGDEIVLAFSEVLRLPYIFLKFKLGNV
ncbi:MAG: protein kinase domain-containing protein [Pyrobaculum sp.]